VLCTEGKAKQSKGRERRCRKKRIEFWHSTTAPLVKMSKKRTLQYVRGRSTGRFRIKKSLRE